MSSTVRIETTRSDEPRPERAAVRDPGLRRNRLVLAGTVLYLLEWVAIIGGAVDVPLAPTTSSNAMLPHYQGHANALAFAAGWFAVVLLGRVVFAAAIVSTVRHMQASRWLTTTAVAAMAVSVGLEVATYAIAAGIAEAPMTAPVVAALNDVAWVMEQMVIPLVGVSVLCLLAATRASRLFGRWVHLPALIGGVMMAGSALLVAPRFAQAYDAVGNSGVPFFWVWMIWISVLCWRAPRAGFSHTPEPAGSDQRAGRA